ncbi:MAG: hypothetical protein NTZ87_00605 [Candidatus Nomurabacteria bacterium]|nr:hypothetical protein [Candidatus Nomurabacteria bacterium]
MDIYTPIEEAGEIIRKRWADLELRKKVEEKLQGDFPEILKDEPHGLIWRCICTPDGEFKRFLDLCEQADLKPIGFENSQDKFHAGNFTKYMLCDLRFSNGINKNLQHYVVKERIVDFNGSGGKRMCDLETLWGENLVDFHHFFLQEMFPIIKDRTIDLSEWMKRRGGTPEKYYFSILSFAICHTVYFDDYDLLESEKNFIDEIILPKFYEVEKYFGFKPIIVKISKVGEHSRDPDWWCYSKESKIIMDNHIKTYKK